MSTEIDPKKRLNEANSLLRAGIRRNATIGLSHKDALDEDNYEEANRLSRSGLALDSLVMVICSIIVSSDTEEELRNELDFARSILAVNDESKVAFDHISQVALDGLIGEEVK